MELRQSNIRSRASGSRSDCSRSHGVAKDFGTEVSPLKVAVPSETANNAEAFGELAATFSSLIQLQTPCPLVNLSMALKWPLTS